MDCSVISINAEGLGGLLRERSTEKLLQIIHGVFEERVSEIVRGWGGGLVGG